MLQQPESISSTLAASPAPLPGSAPESLPKPIAVPPAASHPPQRIPRWLERAELFLRVMLRMYIGLAVAYAPWSRVFWDHNPLFAQFPTIGFYASMGPVKGIVMGLGLLNLWIAFHDAIRRRDD